MASSDPRDMTLQRLLVFGSRLDLLAFDFCKCFFRSCGTRLGVGLDDVAALRDQLLHARGQACEIRSGGRGWRHGTTVVAVPPYRDLDGSQPVSEMMAVTFTPKGKLYYLDPAGHRPAVGDHVLVPTESGAEVAQVVWAPEYVMDDIDGLPKCAGIATDSDVKRDGDNRKKRARIRVVAQRLVRESGLPMKVVGVDWMDIGHESGRPTATIFFSSPSRIDFRQLVRDLSLSLDCKIMLTQLGARDSARIQGGLGPCGRDTCCSTFLVDFEPVSVKMARDQDLPLNPMKISGACGRLMCCLKYEHPLYQDFKAEVPAVGEAVDTPDGPGRVLSHDVPRDAVVIKLTATGERQVCDKADVCGARAAYNTRS
jgi:cell fate regulator YaaT (PSP1 superfamily)